MEEIRSVVTEQNEIDFWLNHNYFDFFGFFGGWDISIKHQSGSLSEKPPMRTFGFWFNSLWKKSKCSYGESWSEKSGRMSKIRQSIISFSLKLRTKSLPMNWLTLYVWLQTKPVVTENLEIENRSKTKLLEQFEKDCLWEIWFKGQNIPLFKMISHVNLFWLRRSWKKRRL